MLLRRRKPMTIRRAMIAAFGLLAIISLSWQASGQIASSAGSNGEHRVPFLLRDGLTYIKARVNGRHATFKSALRPFGLRGQTSDSSGALFSPKTVIRPG